MRKTLRWGLGFSASNLEMQRMRTENKRQRINVGTVMELFEHAIEEVRWQR